nr:hypothetical protein [Tanacetum cinerariifolium]
MLVIVPLDNLKFSDSDDSTFKVDISSRLLVDSKFVELLTFALPMRDSLKSMLFIACRLRINLPEFLVNGINHHLSSLLVLFAPFSLWQVLHLNPSSNIIESDNALDIIEEAGIQLNAEQADWKGDTDDESDDQELEAHYMYMAKIQEVSPDVVDSGPIFDKDPEQKINQNDEDADLAKERELLASLIEKLICKIDETKNRNILLETSNKVLVEKLKSKLEDFKNKNKNLTEANNKLSKENDLLYPDFKKSKVELKRRDSIEYASEMELACAKVRGDFLSYKIESQKSCNKYTQTINDLNQTISEMKNKLSAHQDTISILKQQKDAQIKFCKSREDKEIEKVIDLENKVKVLDNIVYKTGQSVQTMNMLNSKCRTSFTKPEFLKKAKQANPRLYDIGCYNYNLALMLSPESDEVIHLEKESRSKLSDLIRPFDYAKLNSLYDLFVPQRKKSSEQRFFSERSRISHINVQNERKK